MIINQHFVRNGRSLACQITFKNVLVNICSEKGANFDDDKYIHLSKYYMK